MYNRTIESVAYSHTPDALPGGVKIHATSAQNLKSIKKKDTCHISPEPEEHQEKEEKESVSAV